MTFFQRRLIHGFDPKMTIFPTFFFRQYRPGKCLVRYSRTTKMPFQAIKKEVQKVKKLTFFPKGLTHIYGPKMAIFATFVFQAFLGRKMSFTTFQNDKTPFQAIKTRISKSQKIDIFSKGLTHGFDPKMTIFPNFFSRQYWPGKCLL